ncbi:MAG: hypothetical protein AAB911_01325 [Patescibacteria group bacterium]
MKTIFITSFNPFISRNILETGIASLLVNSGIRVVVLVPDYKEEYFKKKFEFGNIVIEGIPSLKLSRKDILFRYLGGSLVNTTTRFFHQKKKYLSDQNAIHFYFSRILGKFFGNFGFVKKFVRWLDLIFMDIGLMEKYLNKYSPFLLFSTDIFHDMDVYLLAASKKSGVLTVGMVRSWDNITNKGLFRIKPDKLIVQNNVIKKEALEHEDMKEGNIFVSGLPQLDHYVRREYCSRDIFLKKLGFNPSDRLIFVGPLGRRFANTDGQLLDILKRSLLDKKIPGSVKFLVRLPPNDYVSFDGFTPDNNFFIYKPGIPFRKDIYSDWEVTMDEDLPLADSLYHSDLVVIYASSLVLDAAALDRPIVLVSFDGQEQKPVFGSVSRFAEYYEHTKKMLKTGACFVAKDPDEMIRTINIYLNDSGLDRSGRNSLVVEQIGKLDGKSASRIADLLSELVLQ